MSAAQHTTSMALLALFVVGLSAPASAQEAQEKKKGEFDYPVEGYSADPDHPDFTPYSPYYTGAFVALGAFAGPSLVSSEAFEAQLGAAYGGWIQASSPLQVLDVRLSYYGSATETTRGADGATLSLRQDAVGFEICGHPLFLAHLENNRFFYTLGSFYVLLGVDVELIQADVAEDSLSEIDFGLQLGAGFDVALDDVDDGGAFWLGVQYRFNQWDYDDAPLRDVSVGQHLLLFNLGYRKNGAVIPI